MEGTRPPGLYEDEEAVMDDVREGGMMADGEPTKRFVTRSPRVKPRSLSDSGGTATKLSPSPLIVESSKRTTKDDSAIKQAPKEAISTPVTPVRTGFPRRGLSVHVPHRDVHSPAQSASAFVKSVPLSPKLDHSHIYASPTNILPRRSRGLDFSRAATSLHHSILAESSPDSSPTIGGRAMNIPNRRSGDFGGIEQSSTSLWSVMGNHERAPISSSLGSGLGNGSESSSSSDDELMDEDMDDSYVTTPQVNRIVTPIGSLPPPGPQWPISGSPGTQGLMSFHNRQRPRKHPRRKLRGPIGLGFSANVGGVLSRSPPNSITKDSPVAAHSRRESISWQANQLHISGSEGDDIAPRGAGDNFEGVLATPGRDGQRSVIRRVVTRRANLLPKTKGFARIRAALAEESQPVESEFRREAEVVRQVLESDMDLEPRLPIVPPLSTTTTSQSSPNLLTQDAPEEVEDDLSVDSGLGISGSFKQQALKNSKGKTFWETFSESNSIANRTTPPPPPFRPRGSSSGIGEDVCMDSPILAPTTGFAIPTCTNSSGGSQRSETPLHSQAGPQPPSAAEITRRINSKRRREDDFDPVSFKRRAVSPGMSVHNSPVMQSPLQRDNAPWGSRPGSNGGDKGGSGAASDSGSLGGTPCNGSQNSAGRTNGKGRVGFQGMVDTNDGLMRMSIE